MNHLLTDQEVVARSVSEVMTSISFVVPDVAAGMSFSSLLGQMGADVRMEPAQEILWRVSGQSRASAALTRGIVSAWADREQIFCAELVLEPAPERVAA